jgi:lantibiotic transport system permease protein
VVSTFIASVRSEWLKRRRSLTTWLVAGGGLFVPAIILTVRLLRPGPLPGIYRATDFWEKLWAISWESGSILILPMGIILITSLVTQIEYRNNTWKQVHASPQPLATIFVAKLLVILVVLAQLLLWFNLGIYLAGIVPALVFDEVPAPATRIPFGLFFRRNAQFFIDVLPIAGLQYLLALRFRNVIVPLGVGLAIWIVSLGSLGWKYNYVIPYSYATIDYTTTVQSRVSHQLPVSATLLAAGCFAFFAIAGYGVYTTKGDRG